MMQGGRRVDGLDVPYNVLVADDYEEWRRYVCAEIRKHPRWRVIGEAPDGLEAVRLSQALAPDLILLDVGLPHLNGIEAARRILDASPDARILFLSQQHCPDIADAALHTGARGYLFKSDAGRDLLFAMEAVVNRGQFVTATLRGPAAMPRATDCHAHHHEAGFYSEETALLDEYARFAEAALAHGNPLICAVSEFGRNELRHRLRGRGFDIERLIAEERCMLIDDRDILAGIVVDGKVSEAAFRDTAVPIITRTQARSAGRLAACGSISAGLWTQGKAEEAIRLERLWDAFAREQPFDIFCGYAMDVPRLAGHHYAEFQSLCQVHSLVHVR